MIDYSKIRCTLRSAHSKNSNIEKYGQYSFNCEFTDVECREIIKECFNSRKNTMILNQYVKDCNKEIKMMNLHMYDIRDGRLLLDIQITDIDGEEYLYSVNVHAFNTDKLMEIARGEN